MHSRRLAQLDHEIGYRPHARSILSLCVLEQRHFPVLLAAAIYFPRIVEVDGLLLLEANFDPDQLAEWRRRGVSGAELERIVNYIEVENCISLPAGLSDEERRAWYRDIAEDIRAGWRVSVSRAYPGADVAITIGESEDGVVLTMETVR